MKGTITKIPESKNQIHLMFEFTPEEFREAMIEGYKNVQKQVKVKGFRHGKVPQSIAENSYGEATFHPYAIDYLIKLNIDKMIEDNNVELVETLTHDSIIENNVGRDKEINTLTLIVTVKPDCEIGDYKNIVIESKKMNDIVDESVEKELNNIAERNSRLVSIDDERPVQMGDVVNINFQGFYVEDGSMIDGGTAVNYQVEIGKKELLFEDQLIGHIFEEEFEATITFPEDYQEKFIGNGKQARFNIRINEIKFKDIPVIDDELALDLGFENLDELKEDTKIKLHEINQQNYLDMLKGQIVLKLVDMTKADIPECMINKKNEEEYRRQQWEAMQRGILNFEELLKQAGTTPEEVKKNFTEKSIKGILLSLAFDKIAELENIQVSDEDIEIRTKEIADKYSIDIEKVKNTVQQNKKETIKEIKENKVSAWLLDIVKVEIDDDSESESESESETEETTTE
jgi:trigger factor